MRRLSLVPLLAVAVLAAPAAASALTFAPATALPPGADLRATLGAPDGGVLLVRGAPTGPYSSTRGSLVIQRVADGRVTTTATRRGVAVVTARPGAAGDADLLLFSSADGSSFSTGRLSVAHLAPDGRLATRWTSPAGATASADLARGTGNRLAVAWSRATAIHVATSGDGRHFTSRVVGENRDSAAAGGGRVAIALRRDGRPLVVVSRSGRPGRTDALTLTAAGLIAQRQTFAADGIPQLQQTAGGRIGLVVHDTGIEGDEGECVGDGRPRRVWATTIESRDRRFHPLRPLAGQRAYCPDGGAPQLLTGPHDQLVVAFGAIPDATRIPQAGLAWSSAGQGFGAPWPVWGGSLLTRAAIDPRDGAVVAALAQPDIAQGHGVTLSRRAPGGALSPPELSEATARLVALTIDAQGRTLAVLADPATAALRLLVGTPKPTPGAPGVTTTTAAPAR